MPKPSVSLREKVPLSLYERIGEYRHTGRRDSKNQAIVALLAAGLAAITKPVTLDGGKQQPPGRPERPATGWKIDPAKDALPSHNHSPEIILEARHEEIHQVGFASGAVGEENLHRQN